MVRPFIESLFDVSVGQRGIPKAGHLLQVLRAEFGKAPLPLHLQKVRDVCRSRGLLGYLAIEDDHAVRKERPSYLQAGTADCHPEAVARVISPEARY